MCSDHETSEHLLGFEDQVEDLLAIVAETSMLPVTIGVLGGWGCGKVEPVENGESPPSARRCTRRRVQPLADRDVRREDGHAYRGRGQHRGPTSGPRPVRGVRHGTRRGRLTPDAPRRYRRGGRAGRPPPSVRPSAQEILRCSPLWPQPYSREIRPPPSASFGQVHAKDGRVGRGDHGLSRELVEFGAGEGCGHDCQTPGGVVLRRP